MLQRTRVAGKACPTQSRHAQERKGSAGVCCLAGRGARKKQLHGCHCHHHDFAKKLKTSWEEFSRMRISYRELGVILLRTAPLQVIFSANYRNEVFVLWKSKAQQKYPATPWESKDTKQAILELFQLFDTDGWTGGCARNVKHFEGTWSGAWFYSAL